MIGHTQPRRIAASSTAKRIAQELGTPLGEHVGYKVRFNDTLQPGAWVKLMTDGILLAETQTDPLLKAYDTIIIDEAHVGRTTFCPALLPKILPRLGDLKYCPGCCCRCCRCCWCRCCLPCRPRR